MIRYCINPSLTDWEALIKRPTLNVSDLNEKVETIFRDIKIRGKTALKAYTQQFDNVTISDFRITEKAINAAEQQLSDDLKQAIQQAYRNLLQFHESQIPTVQKVKIADGITCWRENRAIERVGFYIPGGTAPLFSTVLMLGIPAQLAGCEEIVLCSPPQKHGGIHPAILYAARLVGVTSLFQLGGIQAILAMSLGIEEIPKVYKIFGPGNQYVTAAKQFVQKQGTAIDMPAGPSEVLIIADKTARADFVAADLLSQAEHGSDSQVILLSDSEALINDVLKALEFQLPLLPRKDIAEKALKNSKAIYLKTLDLCINFSNRYAPEHLILAVDKAEELADKVMNAGSVFLGNYSCESAGDYASGTNHTLPTGGYAKSHSGVSVDSFVKKISFQHIEAKGIQNIGRAVEIMADAEGLQAHKNAISLRLNYLSKLRK